MQGIRVSFREANPRGALQYLFALVAMRGGEVRVPRRIVAGIPAEAYLAWSTDGVDDVLSIVDLTEAPGGESGGGP